MAGPTGQTPDATLYQIYYLYTARAARNFGLEATAPGGSAAGRGFQADPRGRGADRLFPPGYLDTILDQIGNLPVVREYHEQHAGAIASGLLRRHPSARRVSQLRRRAESQMDDHGRCA
jgi:hypothetical protein